MNPRNTLPPAFGRISASDVPRLHAEARARVAALRREAIEAFWQQFGRRVRGLLSARRSGLMQTGLQRTDAGRSGAEQRFGIPKAAEQCPGALVALTGPARSR
ncbi:MAG TPA: hypothetical protein PKA20_02380 [Burkholderiaceae bacterium]|nr:hypothetical protein [Burkholderiaceae bacterium]